MKLLLQTYQGSICIVQQTIFKAGMCYMLFNLIV